MTEADSDALLVERVKRGDSRAFELLVVKYQRRIERLIGRMVRDHHHVQDIAQETFIRAYRAMPNFRGDSAFYTWLYRIAVNTAKKALVDMRKDPVIGESDLYSNDESEEPSRHESALSDGETPDAVLARLAEVLPGIMTSAPINELMAKLGSVLDYAPAAALTAQISRELEVDKVVVKRLGMVQQ